MNVIDISSLKPASGGSPRFEGDRFGTEVSFFVVTSPPGQGADKHRHPYTEVFVILEGDIEVISGGKLQRLGGGTIAVVPANTWHEFKNRSSRPVSMVNIHSAPTMIQEDWS